MTTASKRYISVTDTAKLLRKALKAEFPGVKFSVRSSKYSGGASIDVSFTDGPPTKAVQEVCDRYRGATFNAMEDLKEYKDSMLTTEDGAEVVSFGADFVFAHRSVSDELLAACEARVEADLGRPIDPEARCPSPYIEGKLLRSVYYESELARALAYETDAREEVK